MTPHDGLRSCSLNFAHTDSEDTYLKNKKKYGPKWYYADKTLHYHFNYLGYRMNKELHEINYDSHIAFFGCSNTVGIGLELEETFSYRIANQLGIDYINGAIGGASPDFVFYNITHYLNNVETYPKFIVVNWPQTSRTLFWEHDQMHFFLPALESTARHWRESFKEYITENSNQLRKFSYYRDNVKLLCKLADIKLIEVTSWQDTDGFWERNPDLPILNLCNYGDKYDINIDKARDIQPGSEIAHPGIYHQQVIVDYVFSQIK